MEILFAPKIEFIVIFCGKCKMQSAFSGVSCLDDRDMNFHAREICDKFRCCGNDHGGDEKNQVNAALNK